ncbi:MAG: exodeoxyribonuclease VII small subunit [Deltaproteobacteria bacterium]|jgi:exodeoxyribonuclease VII small subunit|nr:exodeoxyribonuclease VII small subunit [Deltaproteobacteria bacterium]MBI3386320.1 exodeoxyribonuclease VII small subunit [Deltaproteobacteria bacterium]
MANDTDTRRFEDAMHELETLVARLESGDLALEDALAAFEQGIGLVRLLNEKLNHAEQRVEILTRDAEGAIRLQIVDKLKDDGS